MRLEEILLKVKVISEGLSVARVVMFRLIADGWFAAVELLFG
jgi:hypothetical protein